MKHNIYIVEGYTWDWEYKETWQVAAYLDKTQAEIHHARLKQQIEKFRLNDMPKLSSDRATWRTTLAECRMWFANTLDPSIPESILSNGMDYVITVVTIYDHFDQFQELHNNEMIQEA